MITFYNIVWHPMLAELGTETLFQFKFPCPVLFGWHGGGGGEVRGEGSLNSVLSALFVTGHVETI